ncbi:MAG: cytochrome P460 family protein [Niastella sp.]|nr:cytochrome P460 family protein [Niastella sp.]
MKKYPVVILVITLFTMTAGFIIRPSDDLVPYPEGYRKWVHIRTGLIGPSHPGFQSNGGFHHIYGNDKAMEGFVSGQFPEGAVLVFDVIEALEKGGSTTEGQRRHVDVMVKDSTKFSNTGGWGYEEFKGNSKTERVLTETVRMQCFKCHTSQNDFVFSEWKE